MLGRAGALEHGRLRVLRAGRGQTRDGLLARLARGLLGDDGLEVLGAREARGVTPVRSRRPAARRRAPRTGAPARAASRPARCKAAKTLRWAFVPWGIWAAM